MWWSKDHRRLANPDDASGVLSFFPLEHVINFTALSEKALLYIEDDFAHHFARSHSGHGSCGLENSALGGRSN